LEATIIIIKYMIEKNREERCLTRPRKPATWVHNARDDGVNINSQRIQLPRPPKKGWKQFALREKIWGSTNDTIHQNKACILSRVNSTLGSVHILLTL
jgi:hypothetical protein